MLLIEVEDDAGFDDLDKPTFLGLCTLYSGIDSLVNHPFAVSTTVAELHKAAGPGTGTGPIKIRGWGPRYSRFSLSANLSMQESLGEITAQQKSTEFLLECRAENTMCLYGVPRQFYGPLVR
jgi:hypothetical protein